MSVAGIENRGLFQRLSNNSGLKKYFFNTSWLMAENILRLLAGLFVGVYVARYLGPEKFGIFSYSLAFVSLFSSIAKLGLDKILIRELLNQPDKTNELLGTAFWLKVAGAVMMMVLIAGVLVFTDNTSEIKLYIFIISLGIIFQAFEVIDFYFQAKVQVKYVSICKTVQLLILCVIKLYLIYSEAELIWFVYLSLIGPVLLSGFLLYAFCSKSIPLFFRFFDADIAKGFLKDSWPLILSGLVIMVYMRIDQIMIKSMLGEAQVGVYSAAVRLSEVWYFVPTVLSVSLFPSIVNARKVSEDLFQSRMQSFFYFCAFLGFSCAIITTVFAVDIIQLLYGKDFLESSSVLAVHIWAGLFVFMGVAAGGWFIVDNLQKLSFYRTFAGAVANVFLNWWLIPAYGVLGAAYATLISQFVASVLFNFFDVRTYNCFKMQLRAILTLGLPLLWRKYES